MGQFVYIPFIKVSLFFSTVFLIFSTEFLLGIVFLYHVLKLYFFTFYSFLLLFPLCFSFFSTSFSFIFFVTLIFSLLYKNNFYMDRPTLFTFSIKNIFQPKIAEIFSYFYFFSI